MKKQFFLYVSIICGFSLLVCNCSKENQQTLSKDQQTITDSETMTSHILEFQKKMEYYKDHPGLKSSESKYVLDAIDDWESTLNMLYCHTNEYVSEIASFDTLISIPIDEEDSMSMEDVSERYYNAILAAVQVHFYEYEPFANNQKLLVVDLEPVPTFDSVSVTTWIGNTIYSATPPYDWKWGLLLGTCDGLHYVFESDAAQECAKYVRNAMYEDPPSGKRWYFTNIESIVARPTDQEQGQYIYENPDDLITNNWLDYLIFYADEDFGVGLQDTVKCIENNPELVFYKNSYENLTQDWVSESSNKKFYQCTYYGENFTSYIWHKLETKLGKRWTIQESVIELPMQNPE